MALDLFGTPSPTGMGIALALTLIQKQKFLPLVGSQEGTAHLPLAILNPGDVALLQDPGYPSHAGGVYLAGGEIYPMPLLAEHQFLPCV